MSKFDPRFYKGTYGQRQAAANHDKAVVYIEHHFNGGSATANYSLANVATNASAKSKAVAQTYVDKISNCFKTPRANNDFAKNGVSVGGYKGRGNGNLSHTNCPAVLLEPLFASNPTFAEIIKSDEGQEKLAQCLVDTIVESFPGGGLVALSVGHKYKPAPNQNDRGVPVAGGGTEADYAEKVLLRVAAKLALVV